MAWSRGYPFGRVTFNWIFRWSFCGPAARITRRRLSPEWETAPPSYPCAPVIRKIRSHWSAHCRSHGLLVGNLLMWHYLRSVQGVMDTSSKWPLCISVLPHTDAGDEALRPKAPRTPPI